jgi:thiamine transport system permease protein
LLFTGVVVGLYAWLQMRAATPRTADILHRKTLTAHQWMPVLGVAWVWLVCISIGLAPLAAIFVKAMIASAATWQQVATAETADALFNTLRFSGAALGVAVVLGVCHALVGRRFWWWRVWGLLPLMISPVMIAFGLLLLVPQWLDAWPLLVAAYALLALPLVIQPVAQALDALPNAWADAARSLGATPWRVWWRVTLPLVRPAVRRGAAFALATMLGEFAVTLFLSRPEWTTLTTLIYQHLGRAGRTQLESAWVLSAGLLALTLFLFWLLEEPDRKDTHA